MFTYRRRAQYHETDQMGIIHHANYVKWMEEARIRYMEELGFSYKAMEETGVVSPVTGISVDYGKSVGFDEEVEVGVSILRYSGAVLELSYLFTNLTNGEVCTRATSKHCFLKKGMLVSLKKVSPELDAKLREEAKGEKEQNSEEEKEQ